MKTTNLRIVLGQRLDDVEDKGLPRDGRSLGQREEDEPEHLDVAIVRKSWFKGTKGSETSSCMAGPRNWQPRLRTAPHSCEESCAGLCWI